MPTLIAVAWLAAAPRAHGQWPAEQPETRVVVENQGGATICAARNADGALRQAPSPIAGHRTGALLVRPGATTTLETCDGDTLWSGRAPSDGALRVDYAAPGPTRPLMLALAARAAVGTVWGGTTTAFGVWQAEARVGVSLGDYGVGLVLRVGVAYLADALGSYSTPGLWFAGEALVAVLGARAEHGFFARGAYFAVGVSAALNAPAITASLHQPIVWLADVAYLGVDITGYVEPAGSFSDRTGQGPFGAVSVGLEVVLSD